MTAQVRQWAQSLPGPRTDIEITLKVIGRRSIQQRRVEAAWPNPPDKATEWPFDNKCPKLIDRPYGSPASENDLKAFTSALSNWKKQIKNYKGYRLNLSGINCQGINLQSDRQDSSDLVFCGAILKRARFEGANLSRVRLKGANLLGARLQGARLWQTFLQGASISDARIEGADLNGVRMEASNLTYSRMEAVGMTGTWLSAATFFGTRLEAASLIETHLEAAQLSSTTLCGAKLYAARLDGADLYRVKFDRTIEIIGTELTGISLREVSIREIGLAQEAIEGAFGDASVEIPQSLRRPLFWPRTRLAHFGEHSFESQLRKWRSDPAAYTPPS